MGQLSLIRERFCVDFALVAAIVYNICVNIRARGKGNSVSIRLTTVRWIASLPASALHAAEAVLDGRTLVDPKLAEAMTAPAKKLATTIRTAGVNPEKLLPHLTVLSAGIPGPLQLTEVALMKVADLAQAKDNARQAEVVRQVISVFQQAVPDVVQQLELRAEPIRNQWEARGPGLLTTLGRMTDPELIVEQAEVVLVYPVLGGGGRAHLPYNTVEFEAVVADPITGLPEVVRLAWLIGQLNCELPKYQGEMTRDQLSETVEQAMIPAVLAASEDVELARCDAATIKLALLSWTNQDVSANPALSDLLLNWWETYHSSRPPWHVALAALRKMMSPI